MKQNVAILGAGRMGRSIADILHATDRYTISLADRYRQALDHVPAHLQAQSAVLDVMDPAALAAFLQDKDIVISACSFTENPSIAKAALMQGLSYFDLTEDVACTEQIASLAQEARDGQVFVPQCGLAPGFIGILGHSLFSRLDEVSSLQLRVGALPVHPTGALKYNLTWSTKGLINEYCHPCLALRGGELTKLSPLQDLEHFSIAGTQYEAFNTSGGLGSLCQTLQGKVQSLDYKSVRYPGHCEKMRFLLDDLRFGENVQRQQALMDLFDDAVPGTQRDEVVIFASAVGQLQGHRTQITEHFLIPAQKEYGRHWTAIARSTAAGVCVAVDLHTAGKLASKGFVRQEDISLDDFLASPLARCYSEGKS